MSREYRVFVHEWTTWDTILTAESEEAAQEAAAALWDDDPDAFSLHDSGTDGITAEPWGEEADAPGGAS